MNTREKLAAIETLTGKHPLETAHDHETFKVRWMCKCGEIGGDGGLTGLCGHGSTAEQAIDNAWDIIESLPQRGLHIYLCFQNRRVIWDRCMWKDVKYTPGSG